jgi:hypothetical protein
MTGLLSQGRQPDRHEYVQGERYDFVPNVCHGSIIGVENARTQTRSILVP